MVSKVTLKLCSHCFHHPNFCFLFISSSRASRLGYMEPFLCSASCVVAVAANFWWRPYQGQMGCVSKHIRRDSVRTIHTFDTIILLVRSDDKPKLVKRKKGKDGRTRVAPWQSKLVFPIIYLKLPHLCFCLLWLRHCIRLDIRSWGKLSGGCKYHI